MPACDGRLACLCSRGPRALPPVLACHRAHEQPDWTRGSHYRGRWDGGAWRRCGVLLTADALAVRARKEGWKIHAESVAGTSLSELTGTGAPSRSARRVAHLQELLQLNKLYRSCLRAEYLLGRPEPVYQSLQQERAGYKSLKTTEEDEKEAQEALKTRALEIVADMHLTAEKLKVRLKQWKPNLQSVFPEAQAKHSEESIRAKAGDYIKLLLKRVNREMPMLPFPSTYVYRTVAIARKSSTPSIPPANSNTLPGPILQIGRAEKAAEKFVTKKILEVRELPAEDILENLQEAAEYVQGLWDRLNGGGFSKTGMQLPIELPMPLSTKEQCMTVMSHLSLELEEFEKKLRVASKIRESKLRTSGIQERTQLAFKLRIMDDEVLQLSRQIAVKSLQLQMEYIYLALEEEVLEFVDDHKSPSRLGGRGTTEEVGLLVAEFCLLDEKLAELAQTFKQTPEAPVRDDVLESLVADITDLRTVLGISAEAVFGNSLLTWRKTMMQMEGAGEKLEEGVQFLVRGVRLLVSDVANASILFSRAALGSTLKAREVSALRRTARDILTLIPFGVILLTPLTPMGHVLVFGFLQRYFPGVFPSQFSGRRQDIITRYDALRAKLEEAQEEAVEEEEEAELARAAAAVAKLTAPTSDIVQRPSLKKLANKVKKLQQQVREAALDTVAVSEDEV